MHHVSDLNRRWLTTWRHSCIHRNLLFTSTSFCRHGLISQTQNHDIYECDEYSWQVSAIDEQLNKRHGLSYTTGIKNTQKSDTVERIN